MIHTTSNLHRILPDPILNFFRPCRLEFLLADGAWGIPQGCVVRSVDILLRRSFLHWTTIRPSYTISRSFCIGEALVVANFPGFDPILIQVRILRNTKGAEWNGYNTNPLIDIPTAVLSPLSGLRHSLVCLEVPVQMTRLLLFSFFCREEPTPTRPTSVRPRFVETGDQSMPWSKLYASQRY